MEELNKAHERLKKGIVSIGEYRQIQEANSTGLTKGKNKLRNDIILSTMRVSTALKAYALTISNTELKVKCSYTDSDLVRSADPILSDIGFLIMGLAIPLKGELTKYFVGELELEEMSRQLAAFKQTIPRRRVATANSKVSTMKIRDVFNEQDLILKEQIDVLVNPFRFAQPDFYHAYRNARSIIDYTGRVRQKNEDNPAG